MNFRKIIYSLGFFLAFALFFSCEEEMPETSLDLQEASLSVSTAANKIAANQAVDQPDGLLARHAPFPDDLSAQFRLKFAEGEEKTHVKNFNDLSTMVVAEVNWVEAGSTTGWHMHPGVVLVSMVEGSIEVVWESDCTPHIYSAGDGWLDPGLIHNATAISEGAKAYATFLGIPNGQPATIWVSPRDCD